MSSAALTAEAREWLADRGGGLADPRHESLVRRLVDALEISVAPWKAARGCLPPDPLGRKPEEVIRELRGHPPGAAREDA